MNRRHYVKQIETPQLRDEPTGYGHGSHEPPLQRPPGQTPVFLYWHSEHGKHLRDRLSIFVRQEAKTEAEMAVRTDTITLQ